MQHPLPVPPRPPVLPEQRPQTATNPAVQSFQHTGGLAEAVVATPAVKVTTEVLDHVFHASPAVPIRQLPDSFFEPGQRLRRDAAPGALVLREAESEELPALGSAHCAFRCVDLQPETVGQEARDACQHPFPRALRRHVDVAVVRIAAEPVTATFQFLVKVIQEQV